MVLSRFGMHRGWSWSNSIIVVSNLYNNSRRKNGIRTMKAFITGISGFVGSHLLDYLVTSERVEVSGLVRHRSNLENIKKHLKYIKLFNGDITDYHSVENCIKKIKPDLIFHLAGQSYVPQSWDAPANTFEINAIGTINLLEAVRKNKPDARVQIAGSSEEYGMVYPQEVPIKETNPLRPLSPYGVSKVAEDLLGIQYHKSYGLNVVVTRAFNHTGPRRGENFVCSNFAKQIVDLEKKGSGRIYVGNLKAKRDFTDVRDVVHAYFLALTKGQMGETYNICRGKAYSINSILESLIKKSRAVVTITEDKDRMRPSDVPILLGNCDKFKKQTGWFSMYPIKTTLEDLLDYWREK